MRRIFFLLLGVAHVSLECSAPNYKTIAVVIPSYNNEQWCLRNLASVVLQDYPPEYVKIIITNDRSTDRTQELLEDYIETNSLQNRVMLINNKERRYSLANLHAMITTFCAPTDVVFDLDGDDWLPHEHVLEFINEVYQDLWVWVTYGQHEWYPSRQRGRTYAIEDEKIRKNCIRGYHGFPMHPRTFYAKLFHLIDVEDLKRDSDFYWASGDVAFMLPILEMAGFHAQFLDEILYVYNTVSPLNDAKVRPGLQAKANAQIRRQRRYQPLRKLFDDQEGCS